MELISFQYFALLLTVAFIFHFARSAKTKQTILSLASLALLAWMNPFSLVIFLFPLSIGFLSARFLKLSENRTSVMYISVGLILLPFLFFKSYLGLSNIMAYNVEKFIFPIGISFYTFRILSYVLDVYRRRIDPIEKISEYTSLITFFPTLLAGPIERAEDFLPQIRSGNLFPIADKAAFFILLGLMKKLVLADNLNNLILPAFARPEVHSGSQLLVTAALARYQIFCNFSGYTDIAIGSAYLFGIKVTNNFNRPFLARSLGEFWRRWHITLYTWVRDYIYFPLLISPLKKFGLYFITFLTFFLLGMWHGFTLNFLLFGFFQGSVMAISHLTLPSRQKLIRKIGLENTLPHRAWQHVFTLIFLIALPTIFFKTKDFSQALNYFSSLLNTSGEFRIWLSDYRLLGLLISFFVLETYHYFVKDDTHASRLSSRYLWSLSTLLMILIVLFGSFRSQHAFIYFSF